MRYTSKSVGYQLMHGENKFVVNCLMILNSRKNGFSYSDYKILASVARKVKNHQKMTDWDWQFVRNRLNNYTEVLAFALNDLEKKKRKRLASMMS